MKQYDRRKPLISIHIPKCAGQSFRIVLKKWFGRRLYRHYFNERKNKMPTKYNLYKGIFKKEFKECMCIHGHFYNSPYFRISDYYPEIDQFITFIRDPFQIHLSNYFYRKKLGQAGFVNGKRKMIEYQYKNIHDYFREAKSIFLFHLPFELTMENYKEHFEKYFIYIGIVEDIQSSVNILAKKLSFPPTPIKKVNISDHDEEVPNEVREDFINKHKLEYAIYNYAKENYKK